MTTRPCPPAARSAAPVFPDVERAWLFLRSAVLMLAAALLFPGSARLEGASPLMHRDPTFQFPVQESPWSISILGEQPDGKLIVSKLRSDGWREILRVLPDGRLDTWGWSIAFVDDIVRNSLPLSNGSLLLSGNFKTVNGQDRPKLSLLTRDGQVQQAFSADHFQEDDFRTTTKLLLRTESEIVTLNLVFLFPEIATFDMNGRLLRQGFPSLESGELFLQIGGYIGSNPNSLILWGLGTDLSETSRPILLECDLADWESGSTLKTKELWSADEEGMVIWATPFGGGWMALVEYSGDNSGSDKYKVVYSDGNKIDLDLDLVSGDELDAFERLPAGEFLAEVKLNNRRKVIIYGPNGHLREEIPLQGAALSGDRLMHIDSQGRLIVSEANGSLSRWIARAPFPELDPRFRPVPINPQDGLVSDLKTTPSGGAVVVGPFNAIGGVQANGVARIRPDGSVDPTFYTGSGIKGLGWTTWIQRDGRVLVGGVFHSVDGVRRESLVRFNTDGSVDDSFTPPEPQGERGVFSLISSDDDSRIYFSEIYDDDGSRNGVVALRADGSVDENFQCPANLFGDQVESDPTRNRVLSLALDGRGRLLAGGLYAAAANRTRYGLARLQSDGTADRAFRKPIFQFPEGVDGRIQDIVVEPNGAILVGGNFRAVNGVPMPGIVRLTPDGLLDRGFNPENGLQAGAEVLDIQREAGGRIILTGQIQTRGGRGSLVRLNSDGTLDSTFGPVVRLGSSGFGSAVTAAAFTGQGRLLVGGSWVSINSGEPGGIVALAPEGTPDVHPSLYSESGALHLGWQLYPGQTIEAFRAESLAGPWVSLGRTNALRDGNFRLPVAGDRPMEMFRVDHLRP